MAPHQIDALSFDRGTLSIDGWSKAGPPQHVIYDNSKYYLAGALAVPRPDVAELFGLGSEDWGFHAVFRLEILNFDAARLLAYFADGQVVEGAAIHRRSIRTEIVQAKHLAIKKRPLAVVTMVKNEPDFLPIWLRHYGRQIGLDDCYVLDHASDDGSTSDLPCSVIRLPASPFEENSRAALVSDFCSSLLRNYEAVLYTDADELIVADPRIAPTLSEYVRTSNPPEIVTMIGMDLLHDEPNEGPLDPKRSVLAQRRWGWAAEAACKPTMIRRPHRWSQGFHLTHEPKAFHHLYNFHIAYADMEIARRRQLKRNRFSPEGNAGGHHRADPDNLINHLRRITPWHSRVEANFGGCAVERSFTDTVKPYSIEQASVLWGLPDRFRSAA